MELGYYIVNNDNRCVKETQLCDTKNYFHLYCCTPHVKWVHCHHGMARPRVADRGDSLQIWRVAANILNKQSRSADSGWSSSLGVGRWANNPSP
jgi:hypothetical protein